MYADNTQFVDWFRSSSPYINAFRGRTFVIVFGGEVISERRFTGLAHDVALLNSLGIRLVLVHGSRPQIEQRLRERKVRIQYVHGRRVTDRDSLECVKEAAGSVSVDIEAIEAELIRKAMAFTEGNQVKAARVLGLSRDALRYRLEKFGLR